MSITVCLSAPMLSVIAATLYYISPPLSHSAAFRDIRMEYSKKEFDGSCWSSLVHRADMLKWMQIFISPFYLRLKGRVINRGVWYKVPLAFLLCCEKNVLFFFFSWVQIASKRKKGLSKTLIVGHGPNSPLSPPDTLPSPRAPPHWSLPPQPRHFLRSRLTR